MIVAIDDFDPVEIGLPRSKSFSFRWEFVFTRSLHRSPDRAARRRNLNQVGRPVDAGILTAAATTGLGTIDARNLPEAHRVLESGRAIGKITPTGFPTAQELHVFEERRHAAGRGSGQLPLPGPDLRIYVSDALWARLRTQTP
ncbi:hypothetical protein [Kitasatospora sp. NPDC059327]|uniref:hypothetical protein n=1 Tax=Kitasatospora sp. NPDC059327 TaxID=3346803 RepID=UPI0036A37D4F